jgi:exocyst complex component 4
MTVIRNLTSSREPEDRDREKANLEYNFKITDEKLDEYVIKHHSDLTSVMHAYSKISTRLNSSKTKLKEVREKLITCQKLLHCKRDELKKLWVEAMENKYVLELLDQVDAICKVDEQIKAFIAKKHYLNATKLLVSSLTNLENNLKHVDALKETRSELHVLKEQMYDTLIEELHRHLYIRSTTELFTRFRQGDTNLKAVRQLDSTPARKVSVADMLSPALKQSTAYLKRKSFFNLPFDLFNQVIRFYSRSINQRQTGSQHTKH